MIMTKLEQLGIKKSLNKAGFNNLRVIIDTSDNFVHRLVVTDDLLLHFAFGDFEQWNQYISIHKKKLTSKKILNKLDISSAIQSQSQPPVKDDETNVLNQTINSSVVNADPENDPASLLLPISLLIENPSTASSFLSYLRSWSSLKSRAVESDRGLKEIDSISPVLIQEILCRKWDSSVSVSGVTSDGVLGGCTVSITPVVQRTSFNLTPTQMIYPTFEGL
jgi:hypothetical protein